MTILCISKRDKKIQMIFPGVRENTVMPGSEGAVGNAGISLDYSAIQRGTGDGSLPISGFNAADDDNIKTKIDIKKFWEDNKEILENEANRLSVFYNNDLWQVAYEITQNALENGIDLLYENQKALDWGATNQIPDSVPEDLLYLVENVNDERLQRERGKEIANELAKIFVGRIQHLIGFTYGGYADEDGLIWADVSAKLGEPHHITLDKIQTKLPNTYKGYAVKARTIIETNNADDFADSILAHIAGPSGSGKTTLSQELKSLYPSLAILDLDEHDDRAAHELFGDKNKQDYTDEDLEKLYKRRQELLDEFISYNSGKKIVLVGYHTEGDSGLKIPTSNKWMLDTTAMTSAFRAYIRSQDEKPEHRRKLTELPFDYKEAKDTINQLKEMGYVSYSSKEINDMIGKQIDDKTDSADDLYQDDLYDENGNADIVKLWNSNPSAFEDQVKRLREWNYRDWDIGFELLNGAIDNGVIDIPPGDARGNALVLLFDLIRSVPFQPLQPKEGTIEEAVEELNNLYAGNNNIIRFNSATDGDYDSHDFPSFINAFYSFDNNEEDNVRYKLEQTIPASYKGYHIYLQPANEENQADDIDRYNDHNHPGAGSFVGDKESGYELKLPLNASKTAAIEVPYSCERCNFTAATTEGLSKHLLVEHKVKHNLLKTYIENAIDARENEIDRLEIVEKDQKRRKFEKRKDLEALQANPQRIMDLPNFDNNALLTTKQIWDEIGRITNSFGYKFLTWRPSWYSFDRTVILSLRPLLVETTIYPGSQKKERISDLGNVIISKLPAFWTYDEANIEAFPLLNEEIKKIPGVLNFQIEEWQDGYAVGLSIQGKDPRIDENKTSDIIEAINDNMVKFSFPNLPPYSDLNRYTQNMEQPTTTDTGVLDIFEEFDADDILEINDDNENYTVKAFDTSTNTIKCGWSEYPRLYDSSLYTQVVEGPDAYTTPSFNLLETYWSSNADDGIETGKAKLDYDEVIKRLQIIATYFNLSLSNTQLPEKEYQVGWEEKELESRIQAEYRPRKGRLTALWDIGSIEEERKLLEWELKKIPGFDILSPLEIDDDKYAILVEINVAGRYIKRDGKVIKVLPIEEVVQELNRDYVGQLPGLLRFEKYDDVDITAIFREGISEDDYFRTSNAIPNIYKGYQIVMTFDGNNNENNVDDIMETVEEDSLTYEEVATIIKQQVEYFGWHIETMLPGFHDIDGRDPYIEILITPKPNVGWDYTSALESLELFEVSAKIIPGFHGLWMVSDGDNGPFRLLLDVDLKEIYEDDDIVEAFDIANLTKQAFVKSAITYDSNPIIQKLIGIPQIKSLIDQHASGYVDEIKVTNPSIDIQQTQQKIKNDPNLSNIKLEQPSGSPYGHMFTYQDSTTHQHKALDKIVRIDRVTDEWGTLITILHECSHHRHPDWSESQVQSEAENLAGTVKQYLTPKIAGKKMIFVTSKLTMPVINVVVADTYQKQIIGLQKHSSLDHESGMLFSYSRPQSVSFHMGSVSFPIDIIFTNSNGQILKICRNCKPGSSEIYSCGNASKVIEVVGSLCAFHDVNVGDHILDVDDKSGKEDFTKRLLQRIQEIKVEEQNDLEMDKWNIRVVMTDKPDTKNFMTVDWSPKDYAINKADIVINPDHTLIRAALKEMSLNKLIRHALLHIMSGFKKALPEEKENEFITPHMFKEARNLELNHTLINRHSTNKRNQS